MDWALLGTETLRVLAAALLCGLIGLERQFRHKNAGVRTHSLVGMGACLFTIVGMDPRVISVAPSAVDTTRIAAQVVSGIGSWAPVSSSSTGTQCAA
jgi:putative Mg2+ transporter-C (MgtC) family protein